MLEAKRQWLHGCQNVERYSNMGVSQNEVYPPVVAILIGTFGKMMINLWILGHLIFRETHRGHNMQWYSYTNMNGYNVYQW